MKKLYCAGFVAAFSFFMAQNAHALPQYRRLLEREYGYKAPCSTCHSQGGGSALSAYGKAFERAGKGSNAIKQIASQVPAGDKFSFDAKLKARANPNDPASTPQNPGGWIKTGSGIPKDELKEFAPPDATDFSILEGELKSDQVEALRAKVGQEFQEEDKFPTFYFGEANGVKKYVVQYVRVPKLDKTLGLVVGTDGVVRSLSFVGKKKVELKKEVRETFVGKKLAEIEKDASKDEEVIQIKSAVLRGLHSIQLVFAKK